MVNNVMDDHLFGLALADNPRTSAAFERIIVASILMAIVTSVIMGMVGAAALTTIAYTAGGAVKQPGDAWAVVGGFLAGFIGVMLLILLALMIV